MLTSNKISADVIEFNGQGALCGESKENLNY